MILTSFVNCLDPNSAYHSIFHEQWSMNEENEIKKALRTWVLKHLVVDKARRGPAEPHPVEINK